VFLALPLLMQLTFGACQAYDLGRPSLALRAALCSMSWVALAKASSRRWRRAVPVAVAVPIAAAAPTALALRYMSRIKRPSAVR